MLAIFLILLQAASAGGAGAQSAGKASGPRQADGGAAAQSRKLEMEGQQFAKQGNWELAAGQFEKAAAVAPRSMRARLKAEEARAWLNTKEYPRAIEAATKALEIDPQNEEAALDLAEGYRRVFNYGKAEALLEKTTKEHPRSAEAEVALGQLEIEMERYDKAIEALIRAATLDPKNMTARDDLAAAYQAKGDALAALKQTELVLAANPQDALAHFLRAEIFADQNKNEEALREVRAVLAAQPNNPKARRLAGKVLMRVPECKDAVEMLEPLAGATGASPNATSGDAADGSAMDSVTLFLLQRAYECAGDKEKAAETAVKFEESSKNDRTTKENTVQAGHLVQLANQFARRNEFDNALDALQHALEKDSGNGDAYAQMAKIYFSEGKIKDAQDAALKALETNRYKPDYLYVEGKILEKEGRVDEALVEFEEITAINPEEADAYLEIAGIEERKRDFKGMVEAMGTLQKCIEMTDGDADCKLQLDTVRQRK